MRILVTGGCGFVGSCLIRGIVDASPSVGIVAIDNFLREGSRGNVEPLRRLGVRVVEGDIRNASDLEATGPVDWVLDCAAEPSVLAGVGLDGGSFAVMDHNLVGTLRLLEHCKRHGAGIVLISTSRVYSIDRLSGLSMEIVDGAFRPTAEAFDGVPGLSERGIAEHFPTTPPLSLYGVSKRCSELVALEYAGAFGIPVWINRCGVLAGAGQFGKPDQGIFSYWIRAWRDRRPLAYIGFGGSGAQVRDCLHPRDLVTVILRQFDTRSPVPAAERIGGPRGDPRICNFGGGVRQSCSLAQLSAWCTDRFGPHVVATTAATRPYDLPWVALDTSQASVTWKWSAETPLHEIFEEIAIQ